MRLAFLSIVSGRWQIYVINADGTGLRRLTDDPVGAIDPTWSPDDAQIAYASARTGVSQIDVVPAAGGTPVQLTDDAAGDQQPRWSPDGGLIAFAGGSSGSPQLWTVAPDGSGERQLTFGPGAAADPTWSPDGTQLAYTSIAQSGRTLYTIARAGGAPHLLFSGDGTEQFPAWSPDGRFIVFSEDYGLDLMPASGPGPNDASVQRIVAAGVDAVWAPLPVPIARATTGTVTVTPPGSSTPVPVASAPTLPTGTVVDASAGGVLVTSKVPGTPASVPPPTVLLQHATFRIVKRTSLRLTISLRPLACPGAGPAPHGVRRPRSGGPAHARPSECGAVTTGRSLTSSPPPRT